MTSHPARSRNPPARKHRSPRRAQPPHDINETHPRASTISRPAHPSISVPTKRPLRDHIRRSACIGRRAPPDRSRAPAPLLFKRDSPPAGGGGRHCRHWATGAAARWIEARSPQGPKATRRALNLARRARYATGPPRARCSPAADPAIRLGQAAFPSSEAARRRP